jgi:uncharacterized protein YecE (DUF72 family)
VLPATEVNSSFHRAHRVSTWARWASVVGPSFRFSVKLPREITHELRLRDAGPAVRKFLAEAATLGPKLGPLLVQTPPSLEFDPGAVEELLAELAAHRVAWEPRHASWFEPEVDAFLAERGVARVAADPAPVPAAAEPGGWAGLRYHRLHGSPRTYHSPYPREYLETVADRLRAEPVETWCIFDNTASGAALGNALEVRDLLTGPK